MPLLMASAATFLSIATVVFGRSLSDAILLSADPPLNIGYFFIYSSLALMALSLVYYRLLRIVNAARLNAGFLLLFAVAAIVFQSFSGIKAPLYIQAYTTFLITAPALGNIIVWNAIGDVFNARQGRRLFYIVLAFSTIGGIVGGLCCSFLSKQFGIPSLLVGYSALFATAALPVVILHRNRRSERTMLTLPDVESQSRIHEIVKEFGQFIQSPLIRNLSIVFFLTAVTTNIIDYSLKDYLRTNYDVIGIASFNGQFNAISSGFNLLVQLTLLSSFLTRFRTRTLFAVTPIVLLIFACPFLFVYSAVCVVLMRFMDMALRFVIQDAAREIALSPLPRLTRNRAKVIFKGVMNPLGGICAGLITLLFAEMLGKQYLPLLIIPVALVSLFCMRNLNRYCANHLYLSLQSSAAKEGILQGDVDFGEDGTENLENVEPSQLVDADENVRMGALDVMLVLKARDEEMLGAESLNQYVVSQIMRDVRLAQATLVWRYELSRAASKSKTPSGPITILQASGEGVSGENDVVSGSMEIASSADDTTADEAQAATDAAEVPAESERADADAAEVPAESGRADVGENDVVEPDTPPAIVVSSPSGTMMPDTPLADALSDIYVSATQRIFKGLMLVHKTEIVSTVYQSLASSRASTRAQALELLQLTISNTPYGKWILILCDDIDLADKYKRLNEVEAMGKAEALDILRAEESRRIRKITRCLVSVSEKKA